VTQPRIRRASQVDAGQVASLIATAFEPLDIARWLVPTDADRVRILTGNFRIWVDHALGNGLVYVVDDLSATAVWFDRTRPVPPPYGYDALLLRACQQYAPRFLSLDAALDEHHPTTAHHHLAFLAVHPDRQREGLGGALLERHHAHLAHVGIKSPTYLEASSADAVKLYERHGFQISEPFFLPHGGPAFWPMTRSSQDLPTLV
jgi:ribosomal protein S18 acetylase RimI-like enzyme